MSTSAAEIRKSLQSEFTRCLARGTDGKRLNAFLDHLFRLVEDLGTIGCTLVEGSSLRLQSGDEVLHEAKVPRARTKLRMLCARLAARCSEWADREVSPYGDVVELEFPPTKQPCKVHFNNTSGSHEFVIESRCA